MNGTPAFDANLPRDVVLLELNGEKIYSVDDAIESLEQLKAQDDTALFRVKRRDGKIAFYEAIFTPQTD